MEVKDGRWSFSSGAIAWFVAGFLGLGIQLGVYMTSIVDPKIPLTYMIFGLNIPIWIRIMTMMIPTARKLVYGRE